MADFYVVSEGNFFHSWPQKIAFQGYSLKGQVAKWDWLANANGSGVHPFFMKS